MDHTFQENKIIKIKELLRDASFLMLEVSQERLSYNVAISKEPTDKVGRLTYNGTNLGVLHDSVLKINMIINTLK